jgi:FkbM family methyltransferase
LNFFNRASSLAARATKLPAPFAHQAARAGLALQIHAAATTGLAERELLLVRHLADPTKASIDVGANWGNYTGEMLKWSRFVIAYEANPVQAAQLQKNWPRAQVQAIGLSDYAGTAELTFPYAENGSALTGYGRVGEQVDSIGAARVERVKIRIDMLDAISTPPPAIGLIKIDVEGLECAVVRGAVQTIKNNRPNLIIESQDSHAPGCPEALVSMLAELNYSAWFFGKDALQPFSAWHDGLRTGYGAVLNNFIFLPDERERPKGIAFTDV